MRKTAQLQIRLTPEEKAAIVREARKVGQEMSSWVLARLLPAAGAQFQARVGQVSRAASSFAWAELNTFLSGCTASELVEATADRPAHPLDAFASNYLAAMVEVASSAYGLPPPAWTKDIRPLRDPYFATSLGSLKPYLAVSAPVAFRRRNLFVDATIGDQV